MWTLTNWSRECGCDGRQLEVNGVIIAVSGRTCPNCIHHASMLAANSLQEQQLQMQFERHPLTSEDYHG